jgi:hypothetical protein
MPLQVELESEADWLQSLHGFVVQGMVHTYTRTHVHITKVPFGLTGRIIIPMSHCLCCKLSSNSHV